MQTAKTLALATVLIALVSLNAETASAAMPVTNCLGLTTCTIDLER